MRTRSFDVIAQLATRRPRLVLIVSIALAVAGALLASARLRLNANTDDLIAPGRPFMVDYRAFLEEFGDLEFIWVVVDTEPDRDRAIEAVDRLVERLRSIDGLRAVHGRVEPEEQLRIATRAMSETQLIETVAAGDALTFLAAPTRSAPPRPPTALAAAERAETLLAAATQAAETAAIDEVGPRLELGDRQVDDPRARAAASGILLLKTILSGVDPAQRAELGLLAGRLAGPLARRDAAAPIHLESDTGRYLFVQVLPEKDYGTLAVIAQPMRELREALAAVETELPGVDVGVTGKPVLQADELLTTSRDMARGAAIGLVLCTILLVVVLRSILRPLLAVFAFLVAFGWTYGFVTLSVGQLNLLSSVFMLVLVAAGVDFGVHMLARYLERRRAPGITSIESVVRDATTTSLRGNATGAATSCAVFLAALATNFQGLRELGVIAAAGLLLCVIAMGLVLPALLTVFDRKPLRSTPPLGRAGHFTLPVRHPWIILGGVAVMTLALGFGLPRVRFEENLLALQNPALESVLWERRLAAESSANSWFGAVVVDSIEEIPAVLDRAAEHPAIGRARSVLDMIQVPTPRREALRGELRTAAANASGGVPAAAAAHTAAVADTAGGDDDATEPAPGSSTSDPARLADALERSIPRLRTISLAAGSAGEGGAEAAGQIGRVISATRRAIAELRGRDIDRGAPETERPGMRGDTVPTMTEPGLAERTAQELDAAVASAAGAARTLLEGDAGSLRDALPAAARASAVSESGRFLVMLHPRDNVWDVAHMAPYIDALRAVDPHATGVPFTHFLSLKDMRSAFIRMALLSLVLVTFLVWLDFRRFADVLVAMIPLSVAMLWLFELMGLFGVHLNLANFFAIPILIGLGIDASIHLLHRYHSGGPDRLDPGSTRRAVIVTNLTTSIGFAPLLFADHLGMRSLGQVMVLGNTACLVSVLLLLPALLALRGRVRKAGLGWASADFAKPKSASGKRGSGEEA